MGTRADFYVGLGESAEWLGSLAFDGYPDGEPAVLLAAQSESEWRAKVAALIASLDDGTRPDQGWPWPWEDSRTTDYAYAWTPDGLLASAFGHRWFDPTQPEPEPEDDESLSPKAAVFPNMKDRMNVALDNKRSGLLILRGTPRCG